MGKVIDYNKNILHSVAISKKGDEYVVTVWFYRESATGENLGLESVEVPHPVARGIWEVAKVKVETM